MAPLYTPFWYGFGGSSAKVEPPIISATGGSKSTSGNFVIHTFTGPGNFVITSGKNNCDVLVVGGGAAGGNTVTLGGGGAGGVIYKTGDPLTPGSITITVGAGGEGGPGVAGDNGDDSVFAHPVNPYTAKGGMNASMMGAPWYPGNPNPGGTGPGHPGGTDVVTPDPIAAAGGWGNDGGSGLYCGHSNCYGGGGGAGAGAVGGNHGGSGPNSPTGGANGGAGVRYDISGSPYYYSGGGGGGYYEGHDPTPSFHGGNGSPNGGGGSGGRSPTVPGYAGQAGSKYGGGGGSASGAGGPTPHHTSAGGDGADGVLIVRYPDGGAHPA